MLEDKIDELRGHLNNMLENEVENSEKILEISRKLDLLIVEYHKTVGRNED